MVTTMRADRPASSRFGKPSFSADDAEAQARVLLDPVGADYVDSLARPSGNITGFTPYDYSMGGKLPELLKQKHRPWRGQESFATPFWL